LVTGGAGFIGSHLVDRLLAAGCTVTVVDDLSTGLAANLPHSHERLTFIQRDVASAISAGLLPERVDEVYHLAAAVGVKLVIQHPIESIETNVGATSALLAHAAKAWPGTAVFLASSSEVYGKATTPLFCEDDDVVYGPTTKARWSYAASKAIDEYLGLAYHQAGMLRVVIGRFFNTVGPRQVGQYGMVLPNFVRAALAGVPLEVYGDGLQSRCFCDVRDVVAAVPALLAQPNCHGRVFNIGSDKPITILALARLVIDTLGCPAKTTTIPYSAAYGAGFEDLRQREPSLERIAQAIGWRPTITLEQTILDLAAHQRSALAPAVPTLHSVESVKDSVKVVS